MEARTVAIPRASLLASGSVALASLVPVSLYQLHLIPRLPDPPGAWFDSSSITASRAAHPWGIPDSLPGMASYALTLALIVSAERSPRARQWLAAKLAFDGAAAGFNLVRQVIVFRRLCSWCTLTSLATTAMVYAGRHLIADSASSLAHAAQVWLEGDEEAPVLDALSPAG